MTNELKTKLLELQKVAREAPVVSTFEGSATIHIGDGESVSFRSEDISAPQRAFANHAHRMTGGEGGVTDALCQAALALRDMVNAFAPDDPGCAEVRYGKKALADLARALEG